MSNILFLSRVILFDFSWNEGLYGRFWVKQHVWCNTPSQHHKTVSKSTRILTLWSWIQRIAGNVSLIDWSINWSFVSAALFWNMEAKTGVSDSHRKEQHGIHHAGFRMKWFTCTVQVSMEALRGKWGNKILVIKGEIKLRNITFSCLVLWVLSAFSPI